MTDKPQPLGRVEVTSVAYAQTPGAEPLKFEPRDLEIHSYLPAAQELTVTMGPKTFSYPAPAGEYVYTVPDGVQVLARKLA